MSVGPPGASMVSYARNRASIHYILQHHHTMKAQLKKGFTLVEIMIVVVIIGLLAALAIPAFKKVRNNAIEKSLLNDARQVSSACQQYGSENATSAVPATEVRKFLSGGNLSSNVLINKDLAAPTVTIGTYGATDYFFIGTTGNYFTLGHTSFDRTISSKAGLTNQTGGGTTYLVFETDTGTPRQP